MQNLKQALKHSGAAGKTKKSYFIIIALCCLAIFTPHFAQYQMSPFADEIKQLGNMDTVQYVSAFSSMMYPAIILAMLTGILADKIGIRNVVIGGMAVMLGGSILRLYARSYPALLVSMCLIGTGCAVANVASPKLFREYFPEKWLSVIMGIYAGASGVGMTLGTATAGLFSNVQGAFLFTAILAALTLAAWIVTPVRVIDKKEKESVRIADGLKVVLKNRITWLLGILLMCGLGCSMALNAVLPNALEERGVVSAAMYASAVTTGNLFGSLFLPAIVGRLFRRISHQISLISILAALGAIFAYRVQEGVLLYAALLATGFFIGGLFPVLLSLPVRTPGIDPRYYGISNGTVVTLQMGGGVLLSSFVIAPFIRISTSVYYLAIGAFLILNCILSLLLPKYD